jgi:hypothetical protein
LSGRRWVESRRGMIAEDEDTAAGIERSGAKRARPLAMNTIGGLGNPILHANTIDYGFRGGVPNGDAGGAFLFV